MNNYQYTLHKNTEERRPQGNIRFYQTCHAMLFADMYRTYDLADPVTGKSKVEEGGCSFIRNVATQFDVVCSVHHPTKCI